MTRSGRLPSITERPEPEWTYLAAPNNVHFWRELVIGSPRKLAALGDLIEREELRPVIDSVLPLSRAAEAHRRLEEGGVRGKIVLRVVES